MMYGQMTAGSWIYIGSQGIVQGTYETFVEMGRQHFGGNLAGRWLLTAGLGGMGGAQPLAQRDGRRVLPRDRMPALAHRHAAQVRLSRSRHRQRRRSARTSSNVPAPTRKPVSVGLLGNAAELLPELFKRGVRPDMLTDQTSAHDPVNGYLPVGWTRGEMARIARQRSGRRPRKAAKASMAVARATRCSTSRRPACPRSTTATTSARSRSRKA